MCPVPAPTDNRGRGPRPALVALGLGSNLGDRLEHIDFARGALGAVLTDLRCSRIYETRPLHVADQPLYLNACCSGRTSLSAHDLLAAFKAIERAAGREEGARYGPRSLDLDILLLGDDVIDEPCLRVPHPRMHERAFVLVPLLELLPEWEHPVLGRTVAQLTAGVSQDGVRLFEPGTRDEPSQGRP